MYRPPHTTHLPGKKCKRNTKVPSLIPSCRLFNCQPSFLAHVFNPDISQSVSQSTRIIGSPPPHANTTHTRRVPVSLSHPGMCSLSPTPIGMPQVFYSNFPRAPRFAWQKYEDAPEVSMATPSPSGRGAHCFGPCCCVHACVRLLGCCVHACVRLLDCCVHACVRLFRFLMGRCR